MCESWNVQCYFCMYLSINLVDSFIFNAVWVFAVLKQQFVKE